MSDRLSELQRQRALLQEHLAWLEGEIAQASPAQAATPVSPDRAILPASAPGPTGLQPSSPVTAADHPQETAGAMAADAKRGCMIAFAIGMVLFFALVLGAYYLTRRGS